MKKLMILPLLLMLSACVSYYQPKTALVDGVYYAEDDPAYVVYRGGYPAAAYYPWSTLDTFYLSYYSFGLRYGYPSVYYPYSSYNSPPWYMSFYNYPFDSPYSGNCWHYGDCRYRNYGGYGGGGHNSYAENSSANRRNRSEADQSVDGSENSINDENSKSSAGRSFASTEPVGYSGKKGLVIRSSQTTVSGKTQLEPGASVAARQIEVASGKNTISSQTAQVKTKRSNSSAARTSYRSTAYVRSSRRVYAGNSSWSHTSNRSRSSKRGSSSSSASPE